MGLPAMSGTELAIKAREFRPDIAVVFATGQNTLPDIPGDSPPVLLQKPYEGNRLSAAVMTAVSRDRG